MTRQQLRDGLRTVPCLEREQEIEQEIGVSSLSLDGHLCNPDGLDGHSLVVLDDSGVRNVLVHRGHSPCFHAAVFDDYHTAVKLSHAIVVVGRLHCDTVLEDLLVALWREGCGRRFQYYCSSTEV